MNNSNGTSRQLPGGVQVTGETVNDKRDYWSGLLMVCLGIGQLAGCCCLDPCASCPPEACGSSHCQVYPVAPPACYGYQSTCWHPWPEECESCPPSTWSAAATDLREEPNSATAPSTSKESLPVPANPAPQPMRDESGSQTQPPESLSSGEQAIDPNSPDADSPSVQKPATAHRVLNTKSQAAPPSSGRVQLQSFQTDDPSTISAASETRTAAYQKSLFPTVVIEAVAAEDN